METMKAIDINRKPVAMAVGGVVAAALCAAALAPAAFADTTASTDVTLQASSDNLSVTAPLTIPFALNADGSFTGPSADATVIQNESAFPVKVESFAFANQIGEAITEDEAADSMEANAWWATVAPNEGEAVAMNQDQASLSADWNMATAEAEGDSLELTCAGAMKNIDGTVDFSEAQELGTITWTFAAGQNA